MRPCSQDESRPEPTHREIQASRTQRDEAGAEAGGLIHLQTDGIASVIQPNPSKSKVKINPEPSL